MRWTCPSDKLAEAQATVEAAFAPAPEEELAQALYALRMMTRGRDGEARDLDAKEVEIHAWLRQLREYPADVAVSCLQDWPKHSSFWPTWHELRGHLEKGVSQRRVMRHVVHQLMREAGVRKIEAQPESDERRAEVVAKCLKRLAEGALGPFDSDRPRGDLVSGRQPAGTDEAERLRAEQRLEALKGQPVTISTPALRQRLGLKEPAPWDEPDTEADAT